MAEKIIIKHYEDEDILITEDNFWWDTHNLWYYATESALITAHPTANNWDFAIVWATDSVWIWDSDTNTWLDSWEQAMWDMLKSENLSWLANYETARDNLEVSKRFTTSHITASVNPAVPYTTYLVNASAWNVTITLPNATNTNDEYRIVLEENTHYVTVTTVWWTQLIWGKTSQIISTVGGWLYIKSSTDHYDIISDTRQLERIVDVNTDIDLSISWYENGTTYHIIPSGWTITITLPDSSSIIEWTNVRFTLHWTGSCIIKTDWLELIEWLQEQVININGAIRLVNDGTHYFIDTDTRLKVQNSAVTFYSLNEDSTIADWIGWFYKQSSTSTTDARYSGTATVVNTWVIGTDTFLIWTISDEWVIQGILPEWPADTILNIGRNTWISSFRFYIKFFKYSAWVETLIWTSSLSNVINTSTISEYIVRTNLSQTSFLPTDRILRKLYATSNWSPTAKISIEWTSPSFSTISAPATSISHNSLAWIQQAWSWITNWHISDQAQTIYWNKTFNWSISASNLSNTNTWDETTTTIWTLINWATEKTTPVDADMIWLMDSAASNILKKLSWLNLKATLKTYFDSLTTTLTNKTINWTNNTITNISLTTWVTWTLPVANWWTWSATQNFVDLTTNQTIWWTKTFTTALAVTWTTKAAWNFYWWTTDPTNTTRTNYDWYFYWTQLYDWWSRVVTTANVAQTVAWIKTFSSFPVTPSSAPTTDYQVANKKYVDDNAWWTTNKSYKLFTNVVPTDLLSFDYIPSYTQATSDTAVYWVTGSLEKITTSILWNWVSMSSLKMILYKSWTPTDNIIVRIETDNAWVPSWTLVNANATATIAWASLWTSEADVTVNFAWAFTLTNNIKYWVVLSRSWPRDISNYYRIWYLERTNSYFKWNTMANWAWGSENNNLFYLFSVWFYLNWVNKWSSATMTRIVWFSNETKSAFDTIVPQNIWIISWFSWLAAWLFYYISSTPWIITSSVVNPRIWFAVSDTEILWWPQTSSYNT